MIGGQAAESGTARSTPTKPHSGRASSHRIAGPDDRDPRRDLREEPRPARRPVPQLGGEVAEGHDHERQARVVVVLERRPVDPGPGDPLAEERDQDQGEGEAPAGVRLPGDEGHRRDAQPPDHEVARVVDRRGRPPGQALLVEPDGLEVERPGPPRRRRGVAGGQVVVVVVHLLGEGGEGLARVAGRPAIEQLVVLDHRPRDVRDDVERDRQDQQAARPSRPPARRASCRVAATTRAAAGRAAEGARRGPSAAAVRPAARSPPARPRRTRRRRRADSRNARAGGEDRRDGEAADDDRRLERLRGDRDEGDRAPPIAAGAADREPHLVVGPGDRVEDVDDDRAPRSARS